MPNNLDAPLDRLLAAQYGAFSRSQARAIGFTPRMIQTRLANGRWIRVEQSVYRHPAYRVTWEQRCMCALLSREDSLLAGRTAAAAHGLTGFNRGRIELVVPPHRNARSPLATVHRSEFRQPRRVRGLAVQSVALTLLEIAAYTAEQKLSLATQDAIMQHKATIEELVDWHVRLSCAHRPGVANMRRVLKRLATGEPPAESVLEAGLHEVLTHPTIPRFAPQAPFPWCPDEPYRLDAYIEPWRMLVEADGRRWHARLLTMENDRTRDHEATRRGYLPLRFGWGDLQDIDEARATIVETASAHGRLRAA